MIRRPSRADEADSWSARGGRGRRPDAVPVRALDGVVSGGCPEDSRNHDTERGPGEEREDERNGHAHHPSVGARTQAERNGCPHSALHHPACLDGAFEEDDDPSLTLPTDLRQDARSSAIILVRLDRPTRRAETPYADDGVGWGSARARYGMADGARNEIRFTAVLRREAGRWRLVQGHSSIGVPNEQAFGISDSDVGKRTHRGLGFVACRLRTRRSSRPSRNGSSSDT
jgi:hypothetical protein